MAEVVKLKLAGRLDLRGNNRFKDLLETHATQAEIIADAMKLKKAADKEINEILGDAKEAVTDGFAVSVTIFDRAEYVVKASTMRRLNVRRRGR